ncbi:hypothetical protein CBL_08915 [Carabus blaptoides fortunei]
MRMRRHRDTEINPQHSRPPHGHAYDQSARVVVVSEVDVKRPFVRIKKPLRSTLRQTITQFRNFLSSLALLASVRPSESLAAQSRPVLTAPGCVSSSGSLL